jgi:hypothetical protein
VLDTVLGGSVGLVDMNSARWAAKFAADVAGVRGFTADCVVKDEMRNAPVLWREVSVQVICCSNKMDTHTSFRSCSVSG